MKLNSQDLFVIFLALEENVERINKILEKGKQEGYSQASFEFWNQRLVSNTEVLEKLRKM